MNIFVLRRGVVPSTMSMLSDLGTQRSNLRELVFSTWGACVAPDPEHPDRPFKVGTTSAVSSTHNRCSYCHKHCKH